MIVVVDTGPLVASMVPRDRDHARCVNVLRDPRLTLVLPALCVGEAAYMIGARAGPLVEAAFLSGLSGFEVVAPEPDDWQRIAEIALKYSDFPIGATDASIVALSERLDTDTLVTLDRRHLGAIVPAHFPAFRLLPE